MSAQFRVYCLIAASLLLTGCQVKMIPVHNLYNQPVNSDLSRAEIGAAIAQGAKSAGWQAEPASKNSVLATYSIRAHTVVVNIGYSDRGYSILYKSSNHMKVKCGTRPDATKRPEVTVGGETCPGGTVPTHIHENYKGWIEELNRSIRAALQAAQYRKRTA